MIWVIYSVAWWHIIDKVILKYSSWGYFHQSSSSVFINASSIRQATFYLTSTTITDISSFGYVFYPLGDANCKLCATSENNNDILKRATSNDNGNREMEYSLFDGGKDGEHTSIVLGRYLEYLWWKKIFFFFLKQSHPTEYKNSQCRHLLTRFCFQNSYIKCYIEIH